jgi:hypothetical protein
MLFGTRVIEFWAVLREYLRVHRMIAFGSGVLVVGVMAAIIWKVRARAVRYRMALLWGVSGLIALVAYVGLGDLSERYVFIASGFFIIALGVAASVWWAGSRSHVLKMIGFIAIIGLIIWNVFEVGRLSNDWKKASAVSQQTLLSLSNQFFPLHQYTSFIFVNTPIRYGRAWIFPTGLEDPLWHVFRFNAFAYTTTNVSSVAAGFAIPARGGYAPVVFTFDNFVLKRVIQHIERVQ